MILQALYELARDEKLVGDPDYEWRPVAWLIRLDKRGSLLGIEGTHSTPPPQPGRRRQPKPLPTSYRVPRQEGRTSAAFAFFFCDKAEYVLGVDPAGKRSEADLARRAALFRERVGACAEETGDEGAQAVQRFLSDPAAGKPQAPPPEDCRPNDLFAFVLAGEERLVHEREAVKAYWKRRRAEAADAADDATCLVTGRACRPVDKHVPVKGVPGGTSSGVALVSFNRSAFESYGWSGNENATVSREAAETCGAALNRLLAARPRDAEGHQLPSRNYYLGGDTVVCYWVRGENQHFADIFPALMEADPERVGELYRSVWRGRAPALEDLGAFYALALSGAQGRAAVRDWFESNVADVAASLARHFADLDIAANTPKPRDRDLPPALPLRTLLRSLVPQGKDENIPPPLIGQVLRAALEGTAYPFSLLQRAVERARAEAGRTEWLDLLRRDARAAAIKAVLNRNHRNDPHFKEITVTRDPDNTEPGYLCGQLMAVLERIQQVALGDLNASVVDRFFSGASATPRAVFTRLLKNARHHVAKAKADPARAGSAAWLERQLDEIVDKFSAEQGGPPAHLDINQQGLFILGYHHMRHWLWMSREARQQWEQQHQAAPETA